jgi:hypothetical protein
LIVEKFLKTSKVSLEILVHVCVTVIINLHY